MTTARRIAFHVLNGCRRSDTPFQALLDREFTTHPATDIRDRNLATELVTGVIRRRLTLDWYIGKVSTTPLAKMDPEILDALRLGVYQLLFLDRIPPRAAVNETVELIKSGRLSHVAGFVNGVLRNVQRQASDFHFPDPDRDPAAALSIIHAHPPWLVKRWLRQFGRERTETLLASNNRPAPRSIRANTRFISRDDLLARLETEGVAARPGRFSPEGIEVVEAHGSLSGLDSHRQGLWTAQDEAAQVASRLLPAPPGSRVVDLCAGRGVKLSHLAQVLPQPELLAAVEISPRKCADLESIAAAYPDTPIRVFNQDAVAFARIPRGPKFHAVLADVPCTGTGTIRRHPDIKWKDFPTVLPQMVSIQRFILEAAVDLTVPRGYVLYVTCSMEREENEGNVEWMLKHRQDVSRVDLRTEGPDFALPLIDEQGFFHPWPPEHDTDGFFAALLRKG